MKRTGLSLSGVPKEDGQADENERSACPDFRRNITSGKRPGEGKVTFEPKRKPLIQD